MSELEQQLADTAEQVAQRSAMGDALDTPREIDHIFFVARKRVDALTADLEAAGYRVARRGGLLKTTLEASREQAVDLESANRFTREMVGLATRHDATYDGWGGMAITPDSVPAQDRPDAVPFGSVDAGAEQAAMRSEYAAGLVADGCPPDLAAELSKDVELTVEPAGWHLTDGSSGVSAAGDYSPSAAREHLREMVSDVIEENREERKPLWRSTGD